MVVAGVRVVVAEMASIRPTSAVAEAEVQASYYFVPIAFLQKRDLLSIWPVESVEMGKVLDAAVVVAAEAEASFVTPILWLQHWHGPSN